MIKRTLERMLGTLARAVVRKYRPQIVAITGSVGKTTTKSACVAVLAVRFRVRGSEKNFNNELGVPLTIIGVDAPGRNPLKWFACFLKGALMLLDSDPLYPQVLVLEMGADHPGDIGYLMSIAPPDVGVVTAVSAAHTEFFESVDGVLAEKKKMVTRLAADKTAIVNADDEQLASVRGEIEAHRVTFGFSAHAQIRAGEITTRYGAQGTPLGTEVQLVADEETAPLYIPDAVGRPVVYAALAGVAVGRAMGLGFPEIQLGLNAFTPPAGRMRVIAGIKKTTIVDDTYNASPRAALEALDAVAQLQNARRKIAVLGDMLELGALTESTHREVGTACAASHAFEMLVTVGPAARFIAGAARAGGMLESDVFSFDSAPDAGAFLQDRLHEGDIVLVKGSQGVRCEKIVKEIMAEPERASELLVRQSEKWL